MAILLTLCCSAAAGPRQASAAAPVAGGPGLQMAAPPARVLVRLDHPARGAALRTRFARLGLRGSRPIATLPGLATVAVPAGESAAAFARRVGRRPGVRYAEPDALALPAAVPGDPFLSEQYALHNFGQRLGGFADGKPDADVDAAEAWSITTGSPDVVVAVLDTGMAVDHPELAGRMAGNAGERGGGRESNGVDDDGNGFVDDFLGWDFADEDNDVTDLALFPHGTAVAGTIAGEAGNGAGISGVAPRARILPLRVGRRGDGVALTSDVIDAFGYATDRARIVNLSYEPFPFSQAMRDAIAAAPDVLFVVSAGNTQTDLDTATNRYPCGFGLPNVVCVAATDHTDAVAPFTSYGVGTVDLAAPGVAVLTTSPAYEALIDDGFEQDLAGRWSADPLWGRTVDKKVSGDWSLTDSPGGNYAPNVNTQVRRIDAVDLTGRTGCRLEYPGFMHTPDGDDLFIVDTDTGGGFATFVFWFGPFDGFFPFETDLPSLEGEPAVRIAFRLVSDAADQGDGVYVDDVRLSCLASTYAGRELLYADGTSFSAPLVAGVAALVRSLAPDLTAKQVRDALRAGTDPLPALNGKVATGGRASAIKALHAVAPRARTNAATGVTSDEAVLTGIAVPRGRAATASFEYGRTAAYGQHTTTAALGPVAGDQPVSALVRGLPAASTVHYRLVVTTPSGTARGGDRTLTTAPTPPLAVAPLPATAQPPPAAPGPPRLSKVKVKRNRRGRPVISLVASERVSLRAVAVPRRGRLVARGRTRLRSGRQRLVLPKMARKGRVILSVRNAKGAFAGATRKLKAKRKANRAPGRGRASLAAAAAVHAGTGNPNFHLPQSGIPVPDPAAGQQPPKLCLGQFCITLPLPPTGTPKPPAPTPGGQQAGPSTPPPASPPKLDLSQATGALGELLADADRFLKDQKKLQKANKELREAETKKEREKWQKRFDDLIETIHQAGEDAKELAEQLNPENWPKSVNEAGVGLRVKQLEALPQFAKDLQKIGDYDQVLRQKADAYYAGGNGGNLDILAGLEDPPAPTYAQLSDEQKVNVAKQAQAEIGAVKVLLDDVRAARKSATNVTFGGG